MKTYLKEIELENFRNIEKAHLCFSDDLTIIYGDNAQGKTNLIESIYLFASGKSFRGVKEKDLMRFGASKTSLKITFEDHIRENFISYKFYSEEIKKRREIEMNYMKLKTVSQLIGNFRAVLFCPEHLSIVKDEPALRRNFLDHAISQLKPTYVETLLLYGKTIDQKSALLKKQDEYAADYVSTMVDIYNNKIEQKMIVFNNNQNYKKQINFPNNIFLISLN